MLLFQKRSIASILLLSAALILVFFTGTGMQTASTITVQLQNSSGNLIPGELLRFFDGTWKTAVNNGDGSFTVSTSASAVTYEMTYEGGVQTKSNVPVTDDPVVFQTIHVVVQLKNSLGSLVDPGTIQYFAGNWKDFGNTTNGESAKELLPYNYKFRMNYSGASQEKYQNVANDPVVVFQTVDVAVQLQNSFGTLMDQGTVQYNAGTWLDFGSTINGEVRKELLPYNYKFRMTYAYASNEKYQDVSTSPTVVFQTRNVAVKLQSSTAAPTDTGTVQYYSNAWYSFGTTSGGQTTKELLPYNYKFRMTYAFATNEKLQDVTNNPTVIFQTKNVVVRLQSSTTAPLDTGKVMYYAGAWKDFGSTGGGQATRELLPYNYKFRMTYAFASNEKFQDVANNPTVVFQTKNVVVQLQSSASAPLDTGKVMYYAGVWKDLGTTSGGQTAKELLPYNYKFRMTYAFASIEKYQDVTTNPIVAFQTKNVAVQLKNSGGQLMDPGAVQYYAGLWKEFGATSGGQVRKELLPYNYKFRMTYAYASNEKYQDVGVNPTVEFSSVLATVQVQNLQGQPVNGAVVKYYSFAWVDFGTTTNGQSTRELLPNNYKFRITYNNITEEKWQDIRVQPTTTFQIDVPPPAVPIALRVFDPWDGSTTDENTVLVNGQVNDSTASVSVNALNAEVQFDGRFHIRIPLGEGSNTITVYASNTGSSASVVRTVHYIVPVLPPDPVTVAPPVDSTVVTTLAASTQFLYTRPNPIQTGVNPADMVPRRAAVVRGKVCRREGGPLSNVKVTILDHPEFGQTLSRADGGFDMAVNGGGLLTVKYEKNGFLPLQRQADMPWQEFTVLDSVVMIGLDPNVTPVDLSDSTIQVASGTATNDDRGARQAVLLFEPGTQAEMVMPDGSTQPLTDLHVRVSEYTVGENGPAAMPAPLPPGIGYTYCVDLTVDEALMAGADEVHFSKPVPFYVENFIGFPTGAGVPSGYYDRKKGVWDFSEFAAVLTVVDTVGGMATIDFNGDGLAEPMDSLSVLGISPEECGKLAALYPPGRSLWRTQLDHFSPRDLNGWLSYPAGYSAPNLPPITIKDNLVDNSCVNNLASTIGIQNQILGEDLAVTGTGMAIHYQSDRVLGRIPAVDIPLSVDDIPGACKRIELTVFIAGRTFKTIIPRQTNQTYRFVWDGKDAYGRLILGEQTLTAIVGYIYDVTYSWIEWECFKRNLTCIPILHSYTFEQAANQSFKTQIGLNEMPKQQFGSWDLNVHHTYDMNSRTLILGDGTKRRAENVSPVIQTVMKVDFPYPDSYDPTNIAFGPDGSLYICSHLNQVIYRMAPGSTVAEVVAGRKGFYGYNGDGISATTALLNAPQGIAVSSDGVLFIADQYNHRIRRVDKNGIINTVAGTGVSGFGGDGEPAVQAMLNFPNSVAVSSWGDVYFCDHVNYRIRKITPDGKIHTVAGTGVSGFSGDGGRAIDAKIGSIYDIKIASDGSVFLADFYSRIRKIDPTGIISTVAGTGVTGFSGDGGPATAAELGYSSGIAVSDEGVLYICDSSNRRIRKVNPDGIITTIAGTGILGFSGDDGPARLANLGWPRDIEIAKDKTVYFSDYWNLRVRKLSPIFNGFTPTDFSVPSEDGSEVFYFNSAGRHLKTVDALTGVTRYLFGYNAAGLLTSVTDMDSLVTRIERDSLNNPLAVVSPFGQRTVLGLDANGYLSSVTNPAGETEHFTYTDKGLMTGRIDPRGNESIYTYDAEGKLVKDEDPAGGWKSLAYTPLQDGYEVTLSSAENKSQKYKVEKLYDGTVRMTNTNESGQAVVALNNTDGSSQVTYPDGTVAFQQSGPDPRFGMEAPITSKATVQAPSGLVSNVTHGRKITQISGLEVTGLADTVTVNGKKTLTQYDGILKTVTTTSPLNKKSFSYLDATGRVVSDSIPGVQSVHYVYDDKGFLNQTRQGDRVTQFTYNAQGRLETVTDPLNRTATMAYDSVGRVLSQTLADGRIIDYSYDANGNLTSLAPPGRPSHAFSHTPVNLTRGYYPPLLPDSTGNTYYFYNLDRQIVRTMFSDSSMIQVVYDTTGCSCGGVGKPAKIIFDRGVAQFKYDPIKGNLTQIVSPALDTLKYTYDGSLPKGVTWKGLVNGSIGVTYNNDFQVTSQTVNGGNSVAFGYDNDGLLASAGALTIVRNSQNGLLTGTALGNVTTGYGYNSLGELTGFEAKYNGSDLFKTSYSLDSLGRINRLSEVIGSDTTRFRYFYDLAGRLSRVDRNDTTISIYRYDANGNRLSHVTVADSVSGFYDAQDRMLAYGNATYGYTATGSLRWKAENGDTTRYYYDLMGNLVSVNMPDGMQIQYLIDGQNRRVGKIVNGKIVKRWLYQNQLNIVAELDSLGNVASRFVYGAKGHVPDYMMKNGLTYQFITDHLGSVRFVVDVASGVVVQYISYDEFGNILTDTNPGLQPFGYAGGLYDGHTGLVRFGARDYEARVGRWTEKDPILFHSSSTNIYIYCGQNPINYIDVTGLRLIFKNECSRKEFLDDFVKIYGTERGKQLLLYYHNLEAIIYIHCTNDSSTSFWGTNEIGDITMGNIYINPRFNPRIYTTNGPRRTNTLRQLAHELGHGSGEGSLDNETLVIDYYEDVIAGKYDKMNRISHYSN